MKNKILFIMLAMAMALGTAGCGGKGESAPAPAQNVEKARDVKDAVGEVTGNLESDAENADRPEAKQPEGQAAEQKPAAEETMQKPAEIKVFIAASLNTVMTEIAEKYNEGHPEVNIVFNADSSGTLQTQIQEGAACDIFFSAAQKQMNALEEEGFLVEGTRKNVVNNRVVVITLNDSGTQVTGLEDLEKAGSIALADGSVPVGKYTRTALVNLKKLPETDDPASITTAEVSEALGGVEISEQSNVSKVLTAVFEGSCEVGTTYYSDTFGYEDQLSILQTVSYDLTGDVIYPVAQVKNDEADDAEKAAAADFLAYITSDEAKAVFDSYYFDTNVE